MHIEWIQVLWNINEENDELADSFYYNDMKSISKKNRLEQFFRSTTDLLMLYQRKKHKCMAKTIVH